MSIFAKFLPGKGIKSFYIDLGVNKTLYVSLL